MIFTNSNVAPGNIIRKTNGNLFFITDVEPECVYYESEYGWRMGAEIFQIEGELIIDTNEVSMLLHKKQKAMDEDKERWKMFMAAFDLRRGAKTAISSLNRFLELDQ